jgi:hypothetical protein
LNTFRKKFPKIVPDGEPAEEPGFKLDDDKPAPRDSKVRGGLEVLNIKTDDTFDPYQRQPEDRRKEGGKRDLRKLSAHIKLMRELEERKKQTDED